MSASPSINVLDRILEPLMDSLTPEVARRVVSLRADAQLQARLDELAEKANEGSLSRDEESEYDNYLEAFHLVTILQAKARRVLDQENSP